MSESEEPTRGEQVLQEGNGLDSGSQPSGVAYYIPGEPVSEESVLKTLKSGSKKAQAAVVSHLLSYALWDDIWAHVDEDRLRELFPLLELPQPLAKSWARYLGLEAPAED